MTDRHETAEDPQSNQQGRSRAVDALITVAVGAALAAPLLAASPARACGGGFGAELEIEPDQTIVVAHDGSVESYMFLPTFCGPSADFGLIVPIPSDLLADPTLGDDRLYAELDDLTEPIVQVEEVCEGSDGTLGAGGATGGAGASNGSGGNGGGVNVISGGTVGIFDWVQLDATDVTAFTGWLDDHAFPYEQEAVGAFEHYVGAGWKFLAFTVKAGELGSSGGGPPAGGGTGGASAPGSICGEFGPIVLSFETAQPVVPARIAASDANSLYREFRWRVFAIAAQKLQPTGIEVERPMTAGDGTGMASGGGSAAGFLFAREEFAGQLDAPGLERYPTLAELVGEGDWVTELQIEFEGMAISDDFVFEPAAEQTPYQEVVTETVYIACDGEGASGGGDGDSTGVFGCTALPRSGAAASSAGLGLLAVPLALLLVRRRRRR